MMSPLLFHIGYHKTATTWFQKQFFLPPHGFYQIAHHREVHEYITGPHGYQFNPEEFRGLAEKKLADLSHSHSPVVSSEILCGNPFFGGRESDVFAERLHQIWPTAKILITIRAQTSVLPSIYMQYVSRGGTMTPKQFFEESPYPGYTSFSSNHFEYDHLVAHYQRLFGADNVMVLPQEYLRNHREQTMRDIANFCDNSDFHGIEPALERVRMPSYPQFAGGILRRTNHVQKTVLNPNPIVAVGETPGGLYRAAGFVLKQPFMTKLFGGKRPISTFVKGHFAGRYTESNARLAELTKNKLDLSEYH